MRAPLPKQLVLAAITGFGGFCEAITLQEAQNDPKKYILYDNTPNNRYVDMGIAAALMYAILTLFIVSVAGISRAIGSTRHTREPIRKSSFMKYDSFVFWI